MMPQHNDAAEKFQRALAGGESETVEFKLSVNSKSLQETICAFANTKGGTIYYGVAEERPDDMPVVQGIDPEVVNKALARLEQYFDPPVPDVEVAILQGEGLWPVVAVIVAKASDLVALSDLSIWRREGTRNTSHESRPVSNWQPQGAGAPLAHTPNFTLDALAPESDSLAFLPDSDARSLVETICALANTEGGRIHVGAYP